MLSLRLNCSRCSAAQAATWRQSSAARVRLPLGALGSIPTRSRTGRFILNSDFLLHDVGTGDGIPIALVEHFGRKRIEKGMRELEASRAPQKQSSAKQERPGTNAARANGLRCSKEKSAPIYCGTPCARATSSGLCPLGTAIAFAPDARWCIGPTQ
jgi:hypothetical protein